MRILAVGCGLAVTVAGVVACGGGNVATVPATPVVSTVTASVAFPAPPAAGTTVAVSLPASGGITPALTLRSGYTAGTQIVVSAASYGQTQADQRRAQSTFAACPVVIDLTAYVTLPLPTAAIAGYAVTLGSSLAFLGSGTFTALIYDDGATQSSGTPPAPAAAGGCAIAPATTSVLATATGSVAGGVVTFNAFTPNANLAPALQATYGTAGANASIPAGTVFGIEVTFVAASGTPAPSAAPSAAATATPTASATATATAHATASPTAGATASASPAPTASPTAAPSTTLATAQLLGAAGFIDPSGKTVYVLSDDTVSSLACTSSCLGAWPIVPPPGTPLSAGFTTFVRSDNSQTQLAYNNHPLYRFSGDISAGQTNGNGIVSFGGTWSVARP